jgi:cytohesin
LHNAADKGRKEVADLLIAKGANVNAVGDLFGGTPLHAAAFGDHKEIVELLIAKGADVNAKVASGFNKGMTPLDLAIDFKKPEIGDLLRKHGGKTGAELKAEGK